MDDGAMPSNTLRNLEVEANKAFDQYREMYFEGEFPYAFEAQTLTCLRGSLKPYEIRINLSLVAQQCIQSNK